VAQFIEEVGGAFYPFSGNNSFGLAVEVLPTDVGRALSVLSEAVLAPAFKPATFATEREAQLAELLEDADDVVTLGRKIVRQKFFGDYPLAIDAQGDEAGLRALAPADLAALHRALVVAPNAVLAVAGDFEPRALLPKLKAFLAKLPPAPLIAPAARFAGPATVGEFVEKQRASRRWSFRRFPDRRCWPTISMWAKWPTNCSAAWPRGSSSGCARRRARVFRALGTRHRA